ncbi:hypothetical protein CC77DRAFT_1090640 [Alternaria alternata]|uniref:Ricin B lectin domain-containing protein n=1 Tax=Alternaria alternata TaxID=5599 RepID=A0A177DZW8_ALTAL|nr:hypothetical protein CC77DRAFT_1090640 [Alternaria alternata]OAG25038.1 hypothetical protein CC77DRAFT_1090640 [Alternaria alternata]OWY45149.1 hypothetical protein AALT_g4014 [Alternaria alternata]
MSDYTGPGIPRTTKAINTHFEIVSAGGYYAQPEKGDCEYHIICANSGLYLCMNYSGGDFGKITAEVRPPLDNDVRWKIAHTGNGTYTINNVNGKTKQQLNVRGEGKASGTEVISYAIKEAANTQFVLKAVVA